MAATQWLGLWQLDLGRSADPLQFHGGSGAGERNRRIIENSTMATAFTFMPLLEVLVASLWLHDRFWSSGAGRIVATRVASSVELSARRFLDCDSLVSFLILLVPTTAMGLTLPVLIEDPMLRQTDLGARLVFCTARTLWARWLGAVLGEGYLIARVWPSKARLWLQVWRVASPQR